MVINSAKNRGRPRIDSEPVNVRLERSILDQLDAYCARVSDQPTRPEAVRRLLVHALALLEPKKMRMAGNAFVANILSSRNVPLRSEPETRDFYIHEGGRYDLKVSDQLGRFQEGYWNLYEDKNSFVEELYRTQKGAFFLVGRGWKHWAASENGEARIGTAAVPLNKDEARAWAELRGLDDLVLDLYDGEIACA